MIILILIVLLFAGCGSPTASEAPEIYFVDATAEQEASGQELWIEIKECVGYDGSRSSYFPVYVVPQPLMCGEIIAAGCYESFRIRVVKDEPTWYLPALGNEFIHYALAMTQQPDRNHAGPMWRRCDWRNN
jgi:hypothetical protein